jgi:hypothetical protein
MPLGPADDRGYLALPLRTVLGTKVLTADDMATCAPDAPSRRYSKTATDHGHRLQTCERP